MLTDYDAWKRDLRGAIAHLPAMTLSAPSERAAACPGGSCFHQALARLYQESQFPQFLALSAWQQAGLSATAGKELRTFKQLIDSYDEPETDAEIMADPQWRSIVQQARKVLTFLN